MYDKYKEDLEKFEDKFQNIESGIDNYATFSYIRKEFLKQSYLNAIDVMIGFNQKAEVKDNSSTGNFLYHLACNDNLIYLKEQRNLIENHE